MSTTILEGVDNEVLLAFVVLIAVGVFTLLYYFNASGQSSYNLLNIWQYLRNFFERQFEDVRSEERQSPDGTSSDNNHSRNVQDGSIDSQDRQETVQTETVQTETVHDSQQINSDIPGPSRSQTEESHDEGQSCRTGLGTSEETSDGNAESSPAPGQLSLRVKHHEVERNYVVGANATVGELKRLSFPSEVAQGRRVRLIYSGRLLHDDTASLSFYGISNSSVIHAQISDMPQPNASQQGLRDDEIELDISRLFIPLLTFILCGCWYGLISYRQLFNTTSTAILVIVTAAYAFMVYVMLG